MTWLFHGRFLVLCSATWVIGCKSVPTSQTRAASPGTTTSPSNRTFGPIQYVNEVINSPLNQLNEKLSLAPSAEAAYTVQNIVLTEAQKARILQAMRQLKENFYDSVNWYEETNGGMPPPVGIDDSGSWMTEAGSEDVPMCLDVSPGTWTDLMAHFYAWLPTYSGKHAPNLRECFSYLVADKSELTSGWPLDYHQAYQYCSQVPADIEGLKPGGNFHHKTLYMFRNNLPSSEGFSDQYAGGPLKKMRENMDDVFRFIMLGRLNESKKGTYQGGMHKMCTVSLTDQQELINEFYGVKLGDKKIYTSADKAQVVECQKYRPRRKLFDPDDGTHCSYDLRILHPLAQSCTGDKTE